VSGAPRLTIDLDKIGHNAQQLAQRLGARGIAVTGVTKACLGSPALAATYLAAGIASLGDSRIDNIARLRATLPSVQLTVIRSPMLSEVQEVVSQADVSCNSEVDIIRALSHAAQTQGRQHQVILMLELGDRREGIMPDDLASYVRVTIAMPNIVLMGIGTNLACRSGVVPDANNMATLSSLAGAVETQVERQLTTVSGGNSANLEWALSEADTGRVNDLRLGEALLLGRETLHRHALKGLHIDAITLHAEVIESKRKPSQPCGQIAQSAFASAPVATDRGIVTQSILAIGQQDIDPADLLAPSGIHIKGASSDHLIIESDGALLPIGSEVAFLPGYSALLRAMTSPFVKKIWKPSYQWSDDSQQSVINPATVPPQKPSL
jgi:predicted amino acid racemase